MQMEKAIDVAMADDDYMVRQAMRLYLDNFPDVMWAGEADDADGAVRLVRETPVDVLLLDLTMPGANGLDVVRSVKAADPDVRVLVISGHPAAQVEEFVLRAGAHRYLEKTSGPNAILQAIRAFGQAPAPSTG